ncbi:MAG: hypothetical protein JWO06_1782 [Bacteroidota bacterium]|nr:hypothetical protein [Bacteroidota bacterium]
MAAFAVAMMVSCNHNSAEKARIKKMISNRGMSTEYFYLADGNANYTVSANGVKTTYVYGTNSVTEKMVDSIRGGSFSSTMHLNAKGLVDSSTASDESGSYLKTYTHDDNGYTIDSKDYASGNLINGSNSVVKDGNESVLTVTDSASKKLVTVYFEYFTDKPNTLSYQNYGMKYLGAQSKNLMKKVVEIRPTGDTMRVTTLNYHFDDKDRVSSKLIYDQRGMLRDSTSYLYY